MKERASFTLDKKTLDILDKLVSLIKYRNRSHAVECALRFLCDEKVSVKEVKK